MAAEIQTGSGVRASTPHLLFEIPRDADWDAAPDGQRFLVGKVPAAALDPRVTLRVVTNWFEELRRLAPTR